MTTKDRTIDWTKIEIIKTTKYCIYCGNEVLKHTEKEIVKCKILLKFAKLEVQK